MLTASSVRVGRIGWEGRVWMMSIRRGKLAEPSGQFQKWEARSTYAAEQEGPGKHLKLLWWEHAGWLWRQRLWREMTPQCIGAGDRDREQGA